MQTRQSLLETPVVVLPDEAGYVDVCEGGHQVLTVESIHDAAVAGDGAGKVLEERKDQGVITSELRYLLSLCLSLLEHDL